jgi:hypothetical protein
MLANKQRVAALTETWVFIQPDRRISVFRWFDAMHSGTYDEILPLCALPI